MKPEEPLPNKLTFRIEGLSHIPSFKNSKEISRRPDGRPFLRTNDKKKAWMERATSAIESELISMCPTTEGVIQLECLRRLLSAFAGLSDDSIREYPEGIWTTQRVPKGQEGATITIERLI